MRLLRAAVGLALLLAATQLAACFNPAQPGCAFSCATDGGSAGLCPSGYSCGGDRLCHRDDGQGSCAIQTDAAVTDAARDTRLDAPLDTTSGQ